MPIRAVCFAPKPPGLSVLGTVSRGQSLLVPSGQGSRLPLPAWGQGGRTEAPSRAPVPATRRNPAPSSHGRREGALPPTPLGLSGLEDAGQTATKASVVTPQQATVLPPREQPPCSRSRLRHPSGPGFPLLRGQARPPLPLGPPAGLHRGPPRPELRPVPRCAAPGPSAPWRYGGTSQPEHGWVFHPQGGKEAVGRPSRPSRSGDITEPRRGLGSCARSPPRLPRESSKVQGSRLRARWGPRPRAPPAAASLLPPLLRWLLGDLMVWCPPQLWHQIRLERKFKNPPDRHAG